jgi:hypothetical protein
VKGAAGPFIRGSALLVIFNAAHDQTHTVCHLTFIAKHCRSQVMHWVGYSNAWSTWRIDMATLTRAPAIAEGLRGYVPHMQPLKGTAYTMLHSQVAAELQHR